MGTKPSHEPWCWRRFLEGAPRHGDGAVIPVSCQTSVIVIVIVVVVVVVLVVVVVVVVIVTVVVGCCYR